jgi:hypothetical protein
LVGSRSGFYHAALAPNRLRRGGCSCCNVAVHDSSTNLHSGAGCTGGTVLASPQLLRDHSRAPAQRRRAPPVRSPRRRPSARSRPTVPALGCAARAAHVARKRGAGAALLGLWHRAERALSPPRCRRPPAQRRRAPPVRSPRRRPSARCCGDSSVSQVAFLGGACSTSSAPAASGGSGGEPTDRVWPISPQLNSCCFVGFSAESAESCPFGPFLSLNLK